MKAGIGYSELPDSMAAGKQAAENAVSMAGRREPCDVALLFCTSRQNQKILREGVSSVLGKTVPIYGGGAAGIITNNNYGYAGDQVGVACLWLDGSHCDVLTDGGLLESEEEAGFRLGQKLAGLDITPASHVMLFYDAVRGDNEKVRLLMATQILAGMEKALGFLPNMAGAGIQGDHACNITDQFTGNNIGKNNAIVLKFSDDIHIDVVSMHGCNPASPYYTVTKADGPVILEINNKPAITFMDELLHSSIKPEQYPFFLLFGVNYGEHWGEYDESKYATRLCLDIDLERDGIVMFEQDMVEGTKFQLMLRSMDLDYMEPKIESAFERLNGREPVFAMYIDCAGRCAGYAGTDVEDALVLQKIVAGRVPLFGIYSGVELATIAERPRVLDWMGVFCLFSQGGQDIPADKKFAAPENAVDTQKTYKDITLELAQKLCLQNAAQALLLDTNSIAIRYELELKRRGFSLISELAVSLRRKDNLESMLIRVAQRVNATLNMQKTMLLISDNAENFIPVVLQGFTPEETKRLTARGAVTIPAEMLTPDPIIVTAEDPLERFADMRKEYNLPFFISSPMLLQGKVKALLLTGRMVEQPPFFSRLARSDIETITAITELLSSVMVRQYLNAVTIKAETDGLTGLWNRNTFQRKVETYLSGDDENSGAFMMIDVDYFKSVNDTYGHIEGDNVLRACSRAMRKVLRDSDIIGRQGGDEFAVFCCGIRDNAAAKRKAEQIREAWKKVIPTGGNKHITASIGISMYPKHGVTFSELYSKADASLYKAKEQGRDRCSLFEPEK